MIMHCSPRVCLRRSRAVFSQCAGLSLTEVMMALTMLAIMAASLASSIVNQSRVRTSVVESAESASFQRGVVEMLIAVPTSDLSSAAWATMTTGLSRPVTEDTAADPSNSGYASSVSQLVSGGIIAEQARAPANLKAFVQYHWATTAAGHRGILDTGIDGADTDAAPDPYANSAASQADLRDISVLGASLIPGGAASVPTGTPFVMRVVLTWNDLDRGGFSGRIIGSSATGAIRAITLMSTRIK